MELQLKNVKFSESLSEETNAFTADIFFLGKKVGYAKNNGQGGCTDTNSYPNSREQFNKACDYAKSLPKIDYGSFKVDSDMESQVYELFTKWLDDREVKRNSNKGLYYEDKDGKRYIASWKGFTMAKLLKHPKGIEAVKSSVLKHQSQGHKILNTNLGSILK